MTAFRYLTRTEWGGTWNGTPPAEQTPDAEVYVHHVGGAAWMGGTVPQGEAASRATAISIFRGLNEYAKKPRPEGKGYQFLDYDALGWWDRTNDIGWIAEGRGQYRSAATLDRNEQGEAFCMCGNYSLREPFPAELELCARGITYMAEQGWTTRTATILGHRDNPAHPGATGCPGDHLYPHLAAIRTRVTQLLNPPPEADMKPVIIIDGYLDQFELVAIGNPEQRRKRGIPDAQSPIVAKLDAAVLQSQLPYQLSPS